MTITTDTLVFIRKEIKKAQKIDPQITDVIISIELKENQEHKNFMYISLPNK
jgi:hypothetical protein